MIYEEMDLQASEFNKSHTPHARKKEGVNPPRQLIRGNKRSKGGGGGGRGGGISGSVYLEVQGEVIGQQHVPANVGRGGLQGQINEAALDARVHAQPPRARLATAATCVAV